MHYLCLLVYILPFAFNIEIISSTTYTCDQTSSCGCSTSQTSVTARIVGGEIAPEHAWKWAISFKRYGSHICGASLLSDSIAITAAHCVSGYQDSPSAFSILAGRNNLTGTGGQTRTVTRIYMHPSYNSLTYDYDIALFEFSPLSASSNIAYICLPEANVDPFAVNSNLVAIGWGVLWSGSQTVSNNLRQVTVQAVASNAIACIRGQISNTDVQFCAGVSGGGKDTCQGDSGGPLMAFYNNKWVLAGLTSSGYGCAYDGYSGIYTRVSYFIPYIYSIYDSLNGATSTTRVTSTSQAASSQSTSSFTSTVPFNQGVKMQQSVLATIFVWTLFLIFH